MVRQSGPDEGDDQQGRKFCVAYLQSSATVARVAGRTYRSQTDACSCDACSKSRRRTEYTCTKIAPQRATGITTVNSYAGLNASYTWYDSAEPKNDEARWRR